MMRFWRPKRELRASNLKPYDGDTHNSEWNLLNELGLHQTQASMFEHHETLFTEADWMYLSNEAINAVRIPIGFWIAEDSNNAEPNPYIRDEAKYLDWAFDMGAKYNVRVWISMHGIHGAQNRYSHTASRDAVVEWIREAHFNKSLDTIRWVSERLLFSTKVTRMIKMKMIVCNGKNTVVFYLFTYFLEIRTWFLEK